MERDGVKQVKCPRCGRAVQWWGNDDRPFCSARCRLADLGNWADESYRIAGEPVLDWPEADAFGEKDGNGD